MEILVYKTDISHSWHVGHLNLVMNAMENIESWTIDTEDVDKILRIVPLHSIDEHSIPKLLRNHGFYCEILE
ncbi:MAG: hypothetical protein MK078_09930 [Crocinitomicaceae bacterium]|nr:hypothetical protein [Crocinitomicaceae bacterium]